MNKYQRISITLPKELQQKFKQYCDENAVNMSGLIAKLIGRYLEDKE